MKSLMNIVFLIGVLSFPLPSYANLSGVDINFVVAFGETDTECGVEAEITAIEGGVINGSERLTVNGVTWGDFSGLPLSGFSVGDKLAFGTNSLQVRLAYNYDVLLDEDICKNLQPNDEIEFVGSFGNIAGSIGLLDPMLHYALGKDASNNDVIVDLNVNSVQFVNLDGLTADVGMGPIIDFSGGGGNGNGNGCHLSGMVPGGSLSWLGMGLFGSVAFLAARRRS